MNTPTQHIESGSGAETQQVADLNERTDAFNAAANLVEAALGSLLPEEE